VDNIIIKGGWVMIPIILGSLVALGITIERCIFFRMIRLDTARFAGQVFHLLKIGETGQALGLCMGTTHPLGRVFQSGMENAGEDTAEVERIVEREGKKEVTRLEKN
jgi:biopolymer transport protein ExbB